MRMLIIALVLALSGCAAMEKAQQQRIAKQNQQDAATCVSYGFAEGTQWYAACRMQLDQMRSNNAAASTAALAGFANYYGQQAMPQRYPSSNTMTNCWNTTIGVSCMTQ